MCLCDTIECEMKNAHLMIAIYFCQTVYTVHTHTLHDHGHHESILWEQQWRSHGNDNTEDEHTQLSRSYQSIQRMHLCATQTNKRRTRPNRMSNRWAWLDTVSSIFRCFSRPPFTALRHTQNGICMAICSGTRHDTSYTISVPSIDRLWWDTTQFHFATCWGGAVCLCMSKSLPKTAGLLTRTHINLNTKTGMWL